MKEHGLQKKMNQGQSCKYISHLPLQKRFLLKSNIQVHHKLFSQRRHLKGHLAMVLAFLLMYHFEPWQWGWGWFLYSVLSHCSCNTDTTINSQIKATYCTCKYRYREIQGSVPVTNPQSISEPLESLVEKAINWAMMLVTPHLINARILKPL